MIDPPFVNMSAKSMFFYAIPGIVKSLIYTVESEIFKVHYKKHILQLGTLHDITLVTGIIYTSKRSK